MEKLLKQKRIWFWTALLTSIFAVVAIPTVVLSAVYSKFLLMGISIALIVHGFYGCVFYWLAFSKRCGLLKIVRLVTVKNITKTSMLSSQSGKSEAEIVHLLRECIVKEYLDGYYYDEATAEICKIMPDIKTVECTYCGANVIVTQGIGTCQYCGKSIN